MSGRPSGGSIFTVLLVGVLWGLNWPTVKFLLTEVPPITIRAIALPLATVILAGVACALGHRLKPARGEIGPIIVTGLLMIGGFNILTSLGQVVTESSRAVIIAYTMPAMTAVLAAIFLKERLGAKMIAALIVGMGGLAVLASENFAALVAEPAGPAIMLVAALSWALGNIALKSRSWSLSPMALTVWFLGVSGVVCAALSLAFEAPWRLETPSAPVLWTMVYHVLGPMVVCYALWNVLLGKLPATVASISILTAPVVGVVSSVLLLGDPPTWQKAVALTMVVASILMTLIRRPERAK